MYKYFQEITSEEHCEFAYEIAYMYGLMPAVHTPSEKRKAENIVHKEIKKHLEKNNIDFIPLYYQTSKGLKKVYPREIWLPAMNKYSMITKFGE